MQTNLASHFLENVEAEFRSTKKLADRAIAQVSDEEFFQTLDPESNSIAITMKHVAGNLRSRWRDFLTSDGEKPDRMRDTEFELYEAEDGRAEITARWEEGWDILFDVINSLTPDDLMRTITIRTEPHTVVQAIHRQLTHYSYHVGAIVQVAKHLRGAAWQTLSVARGASENYNAAMRSSSQKSSSQKGG